ncbi:hypothetical protein [Thalassospira indica]|uniref:NIPSNAP domain-containing protein n=1 Tax=Thalassospira indica TaxID=1891279 RepID=A0ABN5NB39_9PROT|nr:hypothetical protein [Thalassospira indica]AXO13368.1 hypothetical protein DY252_03190 [Thalassospira indica]OAZ14752.1 hypothetical protein TH15_02825 [Thalassospira profundimaris]
MSKDLRNFPYRVVIHEKHSAQAVLDWLDINVMSKNWTMGIRNIELPRGGQNAPIVDMVIYFNRREDMERFRDKWAGKTREHKVKLYGWRAALYALRHPKTEMIAYEKSDEPTRPNPKKPT